MSGAGAWPLDVWWQVTGQIDARYVSEPLCCLDKLARSCNPAPTSQNYTHPAILPDFADINYLWKPSLRHGGRVTLSGRAQSGTWAWASGSLATATDISIDWWTGCSQCSCNTRAHIHCQHWPPYFGVGDRGTVDPWPAPGMCQSRTRSWGWGWECSTGQYWAVRTDKLTHLHTNIQSHNTHQLPTLNK